jgi:hypothetical protein
MLLERSNELKAQQMNELLHFGSCMSATTICEWKRALRSCFLLSFRCFEAQGGGTRRIQQLGNCLLFFVAL